MWSHRRTWSVFAVTCLAVLAAMLWLRWRFREQPNYTQVSEGIYIGGRVDEPPPAATAVLNLSLRRDRYQSEMHRWEPIRDAAPAPNLAWIQRMVDWITVQRREGRTVFVHCQNGVSRSAMVVVAYYMSEKGWSRDRALAFVREKRPIVCPNIAFMDVLLQWQQCLRSPNRRVSRQ